MKTRLWIVAAAATGIMTLAGCAGGPNQQLGTAGGAVGGALVGESQEGSQLAAGEVWAGHLSVG